MESGQYDFAASSRSGGISLSVLDVRSLVDFSCVHDILCCDDLLLQTIEMRVQMAEAKKTKRVQGTDRPIANPTVVLREEFDDWAILFNPDTAEAVGTNPVGVAVWNLMDGTHSLKEIVVEIHDQFAGVPNAAEKDVTAFIKDLAERGFVGYEVKGRG